MTYEDFQTELVSKLEKKCQIKSDKFYEDAQEYALKVLFDYVFNTTDNKVHERYLKEIIDKL